MRKMNLKLMLAGVVVACAFGAIGFRLARATPGAGVGQTLIAGPVELDEIDIKGNTDGHKIKIQTKGEWESRVVGNHFPAGAHTGWHSHSGPAFVMITAGTMTLYDADDPTPSVYPAGTGFVKPPGHVHLARNEGTEDLEVVTFYLTPAGEPIRTDDPQPKATHRSGAWTWDEARKRGRRGKGTGGF